MGCLGHLSLSQSIQGAWFSAGALNSALNLRQTLISAYLGSDHIVFVQLLTNYRY